MNKIIVHQRVPLKTLSRGSIFYYIGRKFIKGSYDQLKCRYICPEENYSLAFFSGEALVQLPDKR